MNDETARSWGIDDIVIGSSARSWLNRKNLLPSKWGLDQYHAEKIKNANIRLTLMYSPASVLSLAPNPLDGLAEVRLVVIDANAFEHPKLTREENIATMLHEIGHVFDDMQPKQSLVDALKAGNYNATTRSPVQRENAADDFAREAGFGQHIASSLRKFVEIHPEKFANAGIDERIRRMEAETT